MFFLSSRYAAFAGLLFLAVALTQGATAGSLIASVAAVVLATACAVRLTGVILGSRHTSVSELARERERVMAGMPAPQHPDTAGRPRTRAPSTVVSAT